MMPLAMPAGGSEKTGDDPYWDKVVFLANMNGANGSTTFIDSSPNFAIANGNAKVTDSVSLFGDTVGAFDGTGDFINLPYLSNYNLGSGNFTIEFWFRPSSLAGPQNLFEWRSSVSTMGVAFTQSFASPTKVSAFVGDSNTSAWEVSITGATTLVVGDWYHVRLVKNGTNFQLYVNGVTQGSVTSSVVPYLNSAGIRFGADRGGNNGFNGQAADVMVSNIARNTSGFTPPSARLVADSNTLVLISMNGANNSVLFENIAPITKLLTPIGNAQISTANFKFGGASGLFDGGADRLLASQSYSFGSGDFTIEGWFKRAGESAVGFTQILFDMRTAAPSIQPLIFVGLPGDGYEFTFEVNGVERIKSGEFTVGPWYHLAIEKYLGVTKMYLMGVNVGPSYIDSNNYTARNFTLCGRFGPSPGDGDYRSLNGNSDDVRCTAYARYRGNFTPPRRQLGKHSPW